MLPESVQNLIDEFSKLPGIGPKTASRLVFYLLSKPKDEVAKLGASVSGLTQGLTRCQRCLNIATDTLCPICQDPKRDQSQIMVVEESLDIIALEKTDYNGIYHVLGGVISPIDGIGPEHLHIKELLERVKKEPVSEIILATNPSLEGEATAMYIFNDLGKISKIKITRIARGLPIGGDLEYADEITLTRALEGRKEY